MSETTIDELSFNGSIEVSAAALKFTDSARSPKDYYAAYKGIHFLMSEGTLAGTDGFHLAVHRNAFTSIPRFKEEHEKFRGLGAHATVSIIPASKLPALSASRRKQKARVDFDAKLIYYPGDKVIPFTISKERAPDITTVIPSGDSLLAHGAPINILKAADVLKHWPDGDVNISMIDYSRWSENVFVVDNGDSLYLLATLKNPSDGKRRLFNREGSQLE